MTRVSGDAYAVYQIEVEQSQEKKKIGTKRFFAQILKIFGKKQASGLSVNSERPSNRIDSIYEAPMYIYETSKTENNSNEEYIKPYSDNNTNDETETPAYNKHLQAVYRIARRYIGCSEFNPKQRLFICMLAVILVLLIIVEVISFSFIFKQ